METQYISINLGEDLVAQIELPSDLLARANAFSIDKEIMLSIESEVSESLIQILRRNITKEHLPPTQHQSLYAKCIAADLELDLSDEVLSSQIECQKFLEAYIPYQKVYLAWRKSIEIEFSEHLAMARKVERGKKVIDCKSQGMDEAEALKTLKVKKVETLRKYYIEYAEFFKGVTNNLEKTEERINFEHTVLRIVEMKEDGEDPAHELTWQRGRELDEQGYDDYRIFTPLYETME